MRFLMIGDGEGARDIRREIAARGLSQYVVFTGARPYHEVPYLVACADLAIAPYDAEKFEPLKRFAFQILSEHQALIDPHGVDDDDDDEPEEDDEAVAAARESQQV